MVRLALLGAMDDAARFARAISQIGNATLAALVVCGARTARIADDSIEVVTDDVASLLSRHAAQFDAVIVLGDPHRCLVDCHRAAEAGKHLLFQRFLALSPRDCAAIDAGCVDAGVRLMAGDSFRCLPQVQAIWKSRNSGQLGEPGLLRMHCWDAVGTRSPGILTAAIDLTIWLYDRVPNCVYASARPATKSMDRNSTTSDYEYLQTHFGFVGGGMALIDHARTLPPGDGYFSLTFVCSRGAAYADDQHNTQLLYRGGPPTALRADLADSQRRSILREFVAAIEENREPLGSGSNMVRAAKVTEAIAESLETHRAISYTNHSEVLVGAI